MSIVVNNHNYEDYLPSAIGSALAQSHEDVEVLVVDDGSTDTSRSVIAAFGDRVKPVFQSNLGQKAALNAGLAAASGDIVMFLDSDDELEPCAASAVASAFKLHPEAGRVVFRLAAVDHTGRKLGPIVPPADRPLPDGDVREAALSFPDDLAWPPTTGNAFASWALARLFPLPVSNDRTHERVGGDFLLHTLIPLLAPVVAVDRVCGRYRVHDRNAHTVQKSVAERSQYLLKRAVVSHAALDELARELGYGRPRPRSVTIAAHRLVSLRLGRPTHPLAGDTRVRALMAGFRAALGRRDTTITRRMVYLGWFLAVAAAPRGKVAALAAMGFRQRHVTG